MRTSNLSLPLTLTVSNMSLYHFIPFFADVGLNIIFKFHKDVISTGIGEEPNRSDKPLMLPLLFFLILLLYTLFSQNFIIYLFFILIFFNYFTQNSVNFLVLSFYLIYILALLVSFVNFALKKIIIIIKHGVWLY